MHSEAKTKEDCKNENYENGLVGIDRDGCDYFGGRL